MKRIYAFSGDQFTEGTLFICEESEEAAKEHVREAFRRALASRYLFTESATREGVENALKQTPTIAWSEETTKS